MPIAQLDWSLIVECPNCKIDIDLANTDCDDDNVISTAIFNNRWEDLRGFELTCKECHHDFLLNSVEY